MKTLHLQQAIIDAIKDLPKERLKDIANYISSIRDKNFGKKQDQKNSIYTELGNLNQNETTHLEEEFIDYKKLYPVE